MKTIYKVEILHGPDAELSRLGALIRQVTEPFITEGIDVVVTKEVVRGENEE